MKQWNVLDKSENYSVEHLNIIRHKPQSREISIQSQTVKLTRQQGKTTKINHHFPILAATLPSREKKIQLYSRNNKSKQTYSTGETIIPEQSVLTRHFQYHEVCHFLFQLYFSLLSSCVSFTSYINIRLSICCVMQKTPVLFHDFWLFV